MSYPKKPIWTHRFKVPKIPTNTNTIHSVRFISNYSKIVSVGVDGIVYIWNIDDLDNSRKMEGHTSWIYSCDYHAEKKLLVTGSFDGTVRIWNTENESLKTVFESGNPAHFDRDVMCVRFSPTGNTVLSTSKDGNTSLWDVEKGKLVFVFEKFHKLDSGYQVNQVVYSGDFFDDNTIVTGGDDATVKVFDLKQKKMVHDVRAHEIATVTAVRCCRKNSKVASGCSSSGYAKIVLHDFRTMKTFCKFSGGFMKPRTSSGLRTCHFSGVTELDFHPSGKFLISSFRKDPSIRIFSLLPKNEILYELNLSDGRTTYQLAECCQFSPSGEHFVSGGHEVFIWKSNVRETVPKIDHDQIRRDKKERTSYLISYISEFGESVSGDISVITVRLENCELVTMSKALFLI